MYIYNDTFCVYCHTNKINGKKYVGQTVHGEDPNKRWRNGFGYEKNVYFYHAIKKYGWNYFDHEIIASNLTESEANHFEFLLIQKLDLKNPQKGYNLKDGGKNGRHSETTKQKMSKIQKDRYQQKGYSQKEYKFADIDKIVITKDELQKISQLCDDNKERIAFTLLADAKYNAKVNQYDYNTSFLTNRQLFILSRVGIPKADREQFLNFLFDNSMAEKDDESNCWTLKYISSDDSNVGMELNESSYKDLGFFYMNYKQGGYKECKKCGRLFKTKKGGNAQKYCKKCKPTYQKIGFKTLKCVDCETEFVVSANVTMKCRCDECQNERRKEYNRLKMQRYRSK